MGILAFCALSCTAFRFKRISALGWFKVWEENLQLDWTKKEDARAAIRLTVKKELRGKVPFLALDNLLKEIIKQAEDWYGTGRWRLNF
ncbi:type I restriction enzyme endonuclease domain-containing protein [Salinimicrobium sp. WS361]|uniref:type I restriction enzyme endonuclease domain-containing protein n=1 Tax=Salinimicrobium sp. WS361 TaxID=3425123 RepID=UPI003D6F0294